MLNDDGCDRLLVTLSKVRTNDDYEELFPKKPKVCHVTECNVGEVEICMNIFCGLPLYLYLHPYFIHDSAS